MQLCVVEIVSGFQSLTESRYVTIADKDVFINYVLNRLPSFSDSYQTKPIDQLVFNYIIRDGEPNDETRKLVNNREDNTGSNFKIGSLNVPVSMNVADYGEVLNSGVILEDNIIRYTVYTKHQQVIIIDSYQTESKNLCEIKGTNIKWIDQELVNKKGGNAIFRRQILGDGGKTFYIQDNKTI